MVWGWVHNFPTIKDVFTKPIDYPTDGFDTQRADWYQDIFDAAEAIQEYLIAGIFEDREDITDFDWTKADLTLDDGYYNLDLSPIVGARKCLVRLKIRIQANLVGWEFRLRRKGYIEGVNEDILSTEVANMDKHGNMWVFTDSTGKVQYRGNAGGTPEVELVVLSWSPR